MDYSSARIVRAATQALCGRPAVIEEPRLHPVGLARDPGHQVDRLHPYRDGWLLGELQQERQDRRLAAEHTQPPWW